VYDAALQDMIAANAASLRELRGRIRSAGSIKKITKAQELIATSRIAKAQARVAAARPYSAEITDMLTNLAAASALDHPLLVARENPKRAAVLVVSSDRGLCGAYTANFGGKIRHTEIRSDVGPSNAAPDATNAPAQEEDHAEH
jgi:ATP synthase F1 gamma subunit